MSPVGAFARAFASLARDRGVELNRGRKLTWLTNTGHKNPVLEADLPKHEFRALADIFAMLGGDEGALGRKDGRGLTPDFLLGEQEQLVELDEVQHFTGARLLTLGAYPDGLPVGFEVAEYRQLCETLRERSDKAFAHRRAVEFPGPNGRQRQRAYFDALRDIGAPSFGRGPVIRVPAPRPDVEAAVRRLVNSLP